MSSSETTIDRPLSFAGLCEAEACWAAGEGPLIALPRIGRRRRPALLPPPDWRQERRMWRRLRQNRAEDWRESWEN